MEKRYFSNNASTTLVSDSGSTITVSNTSLFPSSYPFFVTLESASLVKEIVKVTSLASAGVWNVVRAQEGTTQVPFVAGSKVEQRITAGTLNQLVSDKAELSGSNFTGPVAVITDAAGTVALTGTNSGSLRFANTGNVVTSSISAATRELDIVVEGDNTTINKFSVKCTSSAVSSQSMEFTNSSSGTGLLVIGNRSVTTRLAIGSVLPSIDIGPVWHDSYNQWMTWQTFNANGANYTGYASTNIGQFITDVVTSARTGLIATGVTSLSKTTYAALWNWALHNGHVVALASWTQGIYKFADNGDGTFRIPDLRGGFIRIWDNGRGLDSGRVFGTDQGPSAGYFFVNYNLDDGDNSSGSFKSITNFQLQNVQFGNGLSGAANIWITPDDTRPRNTSLAGYIQF
jgi:hypothetical protein